MVDFVSGPVREPDRDALFSLCRAAVLDPLTHGVVLGEPYTPHLPETWNGLLVVAEAQNLSETNEGYVAWLRDVCDPDARIDRLNRRWPGGPAGHVGVQPWEDGPLKLAVAAAFGRQAVERTAVSNALLWSLRSDDGRQNRNPTTALEERSRDLWRKLLDKVRPDTIVAAGTAAGTLCKSIAPAGAHVVRWQSPSPQYVNRVAKCLFRNDDLQVAFPEVWAVAESCAPFLQRDSETRIFYACHAVSMTRRASRER